MLVSVAEQAGLNLYMVPNVQRQVFFCDMAHYTCSDVVVESDDILCVKDCKPYDVHCVHNKTKSISYQFLALPVIPKIYWPVVLLNITAQGFALVPQMYLYIYSGNEYGLFDTTVVGDTGK